MYPQPPAWALLDRFPVLQPSKDSASVLEDWKAKSKGTAQLMQLMQSYKDLGDSKNEVGFAAWGGGREGGRRSFPRRLGACDILRSCCMSPPPDLSSPSP